jgi:flagellar FliL protein
LDVRLFVLLLSLLFIPAYTAAGDEEKIEAIIEYLEMNPKFTVNLAEPRKYLQVNIQLMVEGEKALASIKKHLPALRHELIMLYSGRSFDTLQTMEQREGLRQESIVAIRETLEKHGSSEGFKDVFFTEFLVN